MTYDLFRLQQQRVGCIDVTARRIDHLRHRQRIGDRYISGKLGDLRAGCKLDNVQRQVDPR